MHHSLSSKSKNSAIRSQYSGRRVDSFQRRAERQSREVPKKVGKFPTYNLKWANLKAFLEEKYHPHTFEEQYTVQGDRYQWSIPPGEDDLTEQDEAQIRDLRDASTYETHSQLLDESDNNAGTSGNSQRGGDSAQPRPLSPE